MCLKVSGLGAMADVCDGEDAPASLPGKHDREEGGSSEGEDGKRLCQRDSGEEENSMTRISEYQQVTDADAIGEEHDGVAETAARDSQEKLSNATEVAIERIQERIETWTNQVSMLLNEGKAAIMNAHNKWEETVIQLHQNRIEAWSEEIKSLRDMDAENEQMRSRLDDAQAILSNRRFSFNERSA